MSKEDRKELKEFKDKYVKEYFECEDWSDYISFCNDQGFDHTEMCYDEMMLFLIQENESKTLRRFSK